MRRKHLWSIALGVAATVYAAYVAVTVQRSVSQLHLADAALAGGAPRATGSPKLLGIEPAATPPPQLEAVWQTLRDTDALAHSGNDTIARTPDALVAFVPDSPDPPEEDSSVLRQRALLDIAVRPEFAELLNSQDSEVRKAVQDFFEDE